MVTPTSRSWRRSYQLRSLGPTTAALGVESATWSSRRSASVCGSQSSCSSQSHSTGSVSRGPPRPRSSSWASGSPKSSQPPVTGS